MDAKNQPIPWMNYPFVDFISNRLNKSLEVFEYGSGFSTLYFQNIVKSIKSVENKKDWFDEISKKAGKNVEIILELLTLLGQKVKHKKLTFVKV